MALLINIKLVWWQKNTIRDFENLHSGGQMHLNNLFTMKDLGVAKYYLGLKIARSDKGTAVTQSKYIHNLLHDAGVCQGKSATTPLPIGIKFSTETGRVLPNPKSYRSLIGRVLYLGFTHTDIAHAAQQLSQFM
ncbi:UNVERIFIED_CONTAM: hypothetical protein Sradi_4113900 [Sesamum radiatum]|uniref:Reverse transcriptase Ty1/copia-type domain-containing protein n=1 Tax=Sesamum radiatum TaxID=300843 RepID=A0AAW2P3D7_SESRA